MADLRYFDEHDRFHVKRLTEDGFVLGRAETCNAALNDDLASREHTRIDRDGDGRYRIRDLGSRNKTYVNGQQVSETLLTDGDIVRIGNHVFEFVGDDAAARTIELSFFAPDRAEPAGAEWIKWKVPVSIGPDRLGGLGLLSADVQQPARAEDVASAALGRLCQYLRADRGLIALRGENKREIRPIAARGLAVERGKRLMPVSQVFAYTAMLQSVAGRYPLDAKHIAPESGYAAAGLVAPLMSKGRAIGFIYLDRPVVAQPFTQQNVHELTAAAGMLAELLTHAMQSSAVGIAGAGQPWINVLRRIQKASTVVGTGHDGLEVVARLIEGQLRCGDAYEILTVSPTRTDVLLLDAGGQGVFGLAQSSAIRTAVRTAAALEEGEVDPGRVTTALNRSMVAPSARQLVPFCWVSIDTDRGTITYVNAGCPPPLLLAGAKRLITLEQTSLLLGVDPKYAYDVATTDLPATFGLVCHTDGLIDASNSAGEVFGPQRLHDLLLLDDSFGKAEELARTILGAVDRHRAGQAPDDDALLVVVSNT